jgi:hypothetical protein
MLTYTEYYAIIEARTGDEKDSKQGQTIILRRFVYAEESYMLRDLEFGRTFGFIDFLSCKQRNLLMRFLRLTFSLRITAASQNEFWRQKVSERSHN